MSKAPVSWSLEAPCAKALILLIAVSSGCTITENAMTVTGSTSDKSVTLSGLVHHSGADIRLQVREKIAGDPTRWGSSWSTIGSSQASLSGVSLKQMTWYSFTVSGVPAPAGSTRWLDGGMAKLRVQFRPSGSFSWGTALTFDDLDCVVRANDAGDSLLTILSTCASKSSPEFIVVDTDRPLVTVTRGEIATAPDEALRYLARRKNPPSLTGDAYYASIGAPDSIADFKAQYGFNGGSETSAIYFNDGDLGFGRDMHCRKSGSTTACYVGNYGSFLDFDADKDEALDDAIDPSISPFATVAMTHDGTNNPNNVRFYVYGRTGQKVPSADLDRTGDKAVPGICLNCHGGTINADGEVVGAQFLPFDVFTFEYSSQPGYRLHDQQEAFRKLNKIVVETSPTAAIVDVARGLYPCQPGLPCSNQSRLNYAGATAKNTYVPAGWTGHETLYHEVIKPYCRTCHIALEPGIAWSSYNQLKAYGNFIHTRVCVTKDMPHAQLTHRDFYESGARALLLGGLGIDDLDCRIGD